MPDLLTFFAVMCLSALATGYLLLRSSKNKNTGEQPTDESPQAPSGGAAVREDVHEPAAPPESGPAHTTAASWWATGSRNPETDPAHLPTAQGKGIEDPAGPAQAPDAGEALAKAQAMFDAAAAQGDDESALEMRAVAAYHLMAACLRHRQPDKARQVYAHMETLGNNLPVLELRARALNLLEHDPLP